MGSYFLIYLFALHFVADFILQSREMATNKSSEFGWLYRHVSIVHNVFLLGTIPFAPAYKAIQLSVINALVHGLIDWYIWKGYKTSVSYRNRGGIVSETYRYWEDRWFYGTIGLDQFLHFSTLAFLEKLIF